MFSLLTISFALLASGPARADAADDAATLLSRFPAGFVPASVSVLDAVGALGDNGSEAHLTLLESLIDEEDKTVREASLQAVSAITGRKQRLVRHRFSPPTTAMMHHWLSRHRHQLVDGSGQSIGRTEKAAIAYAHIVLGQVQPATVTDTWQADARQREINEDVQGALRLYVEALIEGKTEAGPEIAAFGLNPELLMLGVFSTLNVSGPDTTRALDTMIRSGTMLTVHVLTERASRQDPMRRAIALDALSQMLARGHLSRGAASAARSSLLNAAKDPSDNVRTLAQTALLELSTD